MSIAIRAAFAAATVLAGMSTLAKAEEITGRATVIDGDTIAVQGTKQRIRLYGIDAPEGKQTCEDAGKNRYLCGSRSADALAALIGRNGRVSCEEKDRDRYGRIVAECRIGSTVLNTEMVRSGWAVEYKQYSDGRYANAEDAAKLGRRGIWAGSFVTPSSWRRGERSPSAALPERSTAHGSPLQRLENMTVSQRHSCKAATSCEDAVRMWCGGYSGADRDGDGIPCENVCSSKSQVDGIKKRIGCPS